MAKQTCFKNKKGDGPSAITWAVAVFIIFMMLAGLFILVFLFVGKEKMKVWQADKITKEKIQPDVGLIIMENLISFLSTSMENGETIYDLVSKANVDEGKEKRKEIFKREAEKFIDENLPIDSQNYFRVWVRVYNFDEEIGQYYFTSLDTGYETSKFSRGKEGGILCNPSRENTLFISFFVKPNKKIVLCANKEQD